MSALKNNHFDSLDYLVPYIRTGNLIHFGQRTVNHWPVLNLDVPASFVYKIQCFVWFLTMASFSLHLCWLLFPVSPTCFQVLATWIYLFQWILHSWVGLQVAANVLHRWPHKSWSISSRGDSISPRDAFSSSGSRAESLFRVKPMFKVRWNLAQSC